MRKRKRTPAKADKSRANTDIRKDIVEAIDRVWPNGIVDMPMDSDDSYFWELYPKLKRDLSRIKEAALLFEREPDPGPQWEEGSDPDEDPPDWQENSRSYHFFFIGPADERLGFESKTEEPDEEGQMQTLRGHGTIGCAAGVSLLARFAIVRLSEMETFENGSRSDPDIDSPIFLSGKGDRIDPEAHYKQFLGDPALHILDGLRHEITAILRSHAIAVLPKEELQKAVPWLRGGADAFVGVQGELITVEQAFFFEGP